MTDKIVKPERPGGFLDYLPAEFLAREKMIETIEKVFRSFGFDPIETPRIEFLKTLAGETSDTGKNIFHIESTHDDEPLAMPFDHTVPFARLLAANPYDPKRKTGIRLPWRRMVVGPVFRSDTPQSGRYRQFYQFDIDIAGASSVLADAEIVAVMYKTMRALGVERFKIRLNNRKILNGLAELVEIKERKRVAADMITKQMMRILDKLEKIGMDAVAAELAATPKNDIDPAPGLSEDAVEKIKTFIGIAGNNEEKLNRCGEVFKGVEAAEEGLSELGQILECLGGMGIPEEAVEIDFSIARGLDYYTGPVMETVLSDAPEYGSVFSGGRYNDLVSRFTGKELPATGTSIGVDRLFAALKHIGLVDLSQQTATEAMILRLMKDYDHEYLKIAEEIRSVGINTEISLLDDTSFKGQFNFAISRGVKYGVIIGENEANNNTVMIKDFTTRKQEEIPREQLTAYWEKLK